MEAIETARDISLPDRRVAVCGDWHGNADWASRIAATLPVLARDVTTLLHLGDWWMNTAEVDAIFAHTSIAHIYVTLGNHEQWDQLWPLLRGNPGCAVRVSDIVWLLPRPARLQIGGRSVLSLGGAASVDRASRNAGVTWWPEEEITTAQVAQAIASGVADLMLTHEGPAGTPVGRVREILRTNPHRFPADALEASAASRARIREVWDAVRPKLLLHGHMHVAGGGREDDGRRVGSLGRDGSEGNLGILDMRTLRMETPSLQTIDTLAARTEKSRVERERRMNSVAESLHTGVLDGRRPSSAAVRDAWSYIDGQRTLDEIIEDVRRRHTRHAESSQEGEERDR